MDFPRQGVPPTGTIAHAERMKFERIKTPGLASLCYVVGDEKSGKCVVIDPGRDIDEILAKVRKAGLTVEYILETHRQEDLVIGAAPLAEATGAKIVVGRDKHFGHGDLRLADGEELTVGDLTLRALHTPGHTPESMCYALFLPDVPVAWGVFTGDTVFIGEAGRTDLPDPRRTGAAAGELYDAVHAKLAPLGDQALIFPAHGSGSACGGAIAERDDSTIGLERVTNPVFTMSRADFMAHKVDERIPRPPYFAHMERVNARGGAAIATTPADVPVLQADDFRTESRQGVVIDTRSPESFAAGHVPGSYGIWADGLVMFGGWVADAGTPVYLVVESLKGPAPLKEAVLALTKIGIDHVKGVLANGFEGWRDAGLPIETSGTTHPAAVRGDRGVRVLDVRDDTEFEKDGHMPDADHLYVGYLERHLDRLQPPLRKDAPLVVTCQVGHRAGLAVSMLLRHGFTDVTNLLGGVGAWDKLGFPLQHGPRPGSPTTVDIEGDRT